MNGQEGSKNGANSDDSVWHLSGRDWADLIAGYVEFAFPESPVADSDNSGAGSSSEAGDQKGSRTSSSTEFIEPKHHVSREDVIAEVENLLCGESNLFK